MVRCLPAGRQGTCMNDLITYYRLFLSVFAELSRQKGEIDSFYFMGGAHASFILPKILN